jgi:hypothetical protein
VAALLEQPFSEDRAKQVSAYLRRSDHETAPIPPPQAEAQA